MVYSITLYFDTRRQKKNGKYPLKLCVWSSLDQRKKLYPTSLDFTKEEWERLSKIERPRGKDRELLATRQAILDHANSVASKLSSFSFESFEKKMYQRKGAILSVKSRYEEYIGRLKKNGQINTASLYDLASKSIQIFTESTRRTFDKLSFRDITATWLEQYEKHMVDQGRSLTTISIYIRTLRRLYNDVIEDGDIEKELYPFGKGRRKYKVPNTRKVKKALSKEQLRLLFESKPKTIEQEKAKDFWFLSYATNGINIKDIVNLRNRDIQDGKITFYRAKTKTTTKGNLRPIVVFLNDYSRAIIEKYRVRSSDKDALVFDILSAGDTPEVRLSKTKRFTRFINQHIKKVAVDNDLPKDISTYWARHSFASNAVRNGASMEFVQEALGHGNLKVTQNYFAGFEDEAKREFSNKLMDFG